MGKECARQRKRRVQRVEEAAVHVDPRGVHSWGKLAKAGELQLEDPDRQPGELCRGRKEAKAA